MRLRQGRGRAAGAGVMIQIVGTYHELQITSKPCRAIKKGVPAEQIEAARSELADHLCSIATQCGTGVLAEELSEQALEEAGADSIARTVARSLSILHRFCDPNRDEREALGYPTVFDHSPSAEERETLDRRRERYWFQQLQDVVDQEIVFVCGADHVTFFHEFLLSKSIDSRISLRAFGEEIYGPLK